MTSTQAVGAYTKATFQVVKETGNSKRYLTIQQNSIKIQLTPADMSHVFNKAFQFMMASGTLCYDVFRKPMKKLYGRDTKTLDGAWTEVDMICHAIEDAADTMREVEDVKYSLSVSEEKSPEIVGFRSRRYSEFECCWTRYLSEDYESHSTFNINRARSDSIEIRLFDVKKLIKVLFILVVENGESPRDLVRWTTQDYLKRLERQTRACMENQKQKISVLKAQRLRLKNPLINTRLDLITLDALLAKERRARMKGLQLRRKVNYLIFKGTDSRDYAAFTAIKETISMKFKKRLHEQLSDIGEEADDELDTVSSEVKKLKLV